MHSIISQKPMETTWTTIIYREFNDEGDISKVVRLTHDVYCVGSCGVSS